MRKVNVPRILAHKLFLLAVFCGFALPLVLSGCGSSTGSAASSAPTVSITASPASINAGSSSTLTVAATGATQVTVTGSDGSSYQLQATGGTQSVSPKSTATYTATAKGSGGTTTAQATVTVSAAQTPTVNISASPASISAGSASTLTVTATNATSVTISGTDGSSYTLAGTGGTQSVSPTATTTYTATATGNSQTATAQATVTVTAVAGTPTVKITASPASVISGASSNLTVTATNATQVTVKGSDGSSYTLTATGGNQVVTPLQTTTYTATATGTGGQATAQTTVTVTAPPAPTVAITATANPISSGQSAVLNVIANNATQVTVTGTDGSNYPLSTSGGAQTVSPTATTTYTATATGAGGTVTAMLTLTVNAAQSPTVAISANPTSVITGNASTLTVTATNATAVTISGSDGTTYTLPAAGGTQSVSPTATTTYTATATNGSGGNATAQVTVTVAAAGSLNSIDHVIFMLQENHTFDNYFGELNPYRHANNYYMGDDGKDYEVDGIDGRESKFTNQDDEGTTYPLYKFKSTCIDDETSSWLASYGEVNRYNFTTSRTTPMDGFVHNAEGFAKSCAQAGSGCSGAFTDTTGERSMGYYDQSFLNYYYYMASQFAVSDRWFSPVSSKSVDNRIATFTGGTTQGLVEDPGNDGLGQLNISSIFQKLDQAKVSWKIYYTVTQGFCLQDDECEAKGSNAYYPATDFSELDYSYQYLYMNPSGAACSGTTQPSSVVGDSTNSFCIDPNHIAPLSQYFTDLKNGSLPSFAFIEAGYANNDEHPGSGQSILSGQAQVANVIDSLMGSTSWKDSVFFLAYDEGGGPFDHVPPVAGQTNDFTAASVLSSYPTDISSIAVNPDSYKPCLRNAGDTDPNDAASIYHCDLASGEPGTSPTDAPAVQGFAAQLGFRVPNMVISPFTRKHYVGHVPMDHTAVIKFVENRFIGGSAHLTARDAAQPNLLDFFDFTNDPWATPPTPPAPVTPTTLGYDPCEPANMGP